MLLKQIKYFLAVVDNESFTRAAEQCDVSQSAISQQVSALEKELGAILLKRHNRTFCLTDAGRYFYEHASEITRELAEVTAETGRIGAGESVTE